MLADYGSVPTAALCNSQLQTTEIKKQKPILPLRSHAIERNDATNQLERDSGFSITVLFHSRFRYMASFHEFPTP
jgi:hypothetical protein